MTEIKTEKEIQTSFGRFMSNKWTKPMIGISILIGYIILMLSFGSTGIFKGTSMKVAKNGILGLLMGYVLQRSFFGFAGTSARTGKGNPKLAYAVLAMFGFVAIVVALLAPSSAIFGESIVKHARPIGLGTALGAIIFGIGMVLARACASGALTDFGSAGAVRIGIVLVFFVIGAGPGQMIQDTMVGRTSGLGVAKPTSLVQLLGGKFDKSHLFSSANVWSLFGAVVLTLLFLATLALVAYLVAKKIRNVRGVKIKDLEEMMDESPDVFNKWIKENHIKLSRDDAKFFSKDTLWKFYFHTFAKKISVWLGAVFFGGLMIAAIYINKKGWGVTTSFSNMMGWITGEHSMIHHKITSTGIHYTTIMEDSGTWRNLGLLLGALGYMFTSYKAKWISDWHGFKNKKTWIGFSTAALAGFFLGFGARMADGCNAGQWATGMTTFSLSGWLFGIFMTGGAALAIATPFIYRKIKNRK